MPKIIPHQRCVIFLTTVSQQERGSAALFRDNTGKDYSVNKGWSSWVDVVRGDGKVSPCGEEPNKSGVRYLQGEGEDWR